MKHAATAVVIVGLLGLVPLGCTKTFKRLDYAPAADAAVGLPATRPVVLMPFVDGRPDAVADPEGGPYIFAALGWKPFFAERPVAEEVRGMMAAWLRASGVKDVRLAPADAAGPRGRPLPTATLPADALVFGGVLVQFAALIPVNPAEAEGRATATMTYAMKAFIYDQRAGCVLAEETFVGTGGPMGDPGTIFPGADQDREVAKFAVSGLDRWFASMMGPGSPLAAAVARGTCPTP